MRGTWKNVTLTCPDCGEDFRAGARRRDEHGRYLAQGWAPNCDCDLTFTVVQPLIDEALNEEETV